MLSPELELCKTQGLTAQEQSSGTSIDQTPNNNMMIFGIVALIVICALLGGMFLLRGRDSDEYQGFQWANTTLPASDAVANSMYGGAQQIFQQPLQTPQYAQQYQPPAHSPQYKIKIQSKRYAQQPQPATQPAPPQNIPQVPVHEDHHCHQEAYRQVGVWISGNTTDNNI